VQQVNDRAYFKRGNLWVDSQVAEGAAGATKPDRVVEIGTPEFNELVDQLASTNQLGCFALKGEILLNYKGQNVLVK